MTTPPPESPFELCGLAGDDPQDRYAAEDSAGSAIKLMMAGDMCGA